jgi:hypothetical protein
MEKIIKLTESDLTNIVKRVIKENATKDSLIEMIKEEGWRSVVELVGGFKNLKKLTGIGSPMEFLNLFNDLDVVQSKEEPNWTLFRYEEGNNMMIYDRKSNDIYINYDVIWESLKKGFDLKYFEIEELTEEWLSEAYNLGGVTIPMMIQSLYQLVV